MVQVFKVLLATIVVVLGQLYFAPLVKIGSVRPDLVLILLVFVSARYGRIAGILLGFSVGMFQDLAGSISVLGVNSLSKSIVGFAVGTLNGNITVWTQKIVNLYVYASLLGHAVIYQFLMLQGFDYNLTILATNITIEFLFSSFMITGLRYFIPFLKSDL